MSDVLLAIEEVDDGSGLVRQMYQFSCLCSNVEPEHDDGYVNDNFYVFFEPSNNHLHIQCFDCHQVYCPFKQCVPPPTAEVVGVRELPPKRYT